MSEFDKYVRGTNYSDNLKRLIKSHMNRLYHLSWELGVMQADFKDILDGVDRHIKGIDSDDSDLESTEGYEQTLAESSVILTPPELSTMLPPPPPLKRLRTK